MLLKVKKKRKKKGGGGGKRICHLLLDEIKSTVSFYCRAAVSDVLSYLYIDSSSGREVDNIVNAY